ncbi:unnamed protein product [Lactuca saligna]|uniref:Uncharacterized protein n=1 Tax=Lactuca saligna TaxID=75948 RepID=A0AA35V4D8_LACSI|nr:unnamed protein product [Lactuca saligna]
MASSTVSLRFRSLPSSTITFRKFFEATPSSPVVTELSLSLDSELDDDLSTGVDELPEQHFSPEFKLFVCSFPFSVDNQLLLGCLNALEMWRSPRILMVEISDLVSLYLRKGNNFQQSCV